MAGLSMGGFGSVNLGLSHLAQYHGSSGQMSGALGMTWWNLGRAWDSPYRPALGPEGSGEREHYNPWRVLERTLATHPVEAFPRMALLVGTEDDPDVVDANRAFHASLNAAQIPHEYSEQPGGHDWDYWRRATPRLVEFCVKALLRR